MLNIHFNSFFFFADSLLGSASEDEEDDDTSSTGTVLKHHGSLHSSGGLTGSGVAGETNNNSLSHGEIASSLGTVSDKVF